MGSHKKELGNSLELKANAGGMGMGRFQKEYRVGFWVEEGVAGPSPALGLSFLLCAMGEARSIEGKRGKAHGEHYEQKINVQIKSEKLWCMPVCWGGGGGSHLEQ